MAVRAGEKHLRGVDVETDSQAYEKRQWYDASVSGPLVGDELEDFLMGPRSPWLIKVTTLKEDGWPFTVPLWYHWDGEAFWTVTRKRSDWIHDVHRDSRSSICVEEREIPPEGGNRKVLAQTIAEVVEGPCVAEGSQWLPIAEKMALRYVGPDGPGALSRSYGWERYLVKFTPRDGKLITFQGVDWHQRYFDPGQRPDLEKRAAQAEAQGSEAS